MNFKNLAIHAKHTAVCSVLALAAAACQSDEEKLANIDSDILRVEQEIENTYLHNEATDSISRNPMLQILSQWIKEDAHYIDSLQHRNFTLEDSTKQHNIRRAAVRYPLNTILSKTDLRTIQEQLRQFHNKWNNKSAENIITGRGTLLDLYNISFDLNYIMFEPPFRIINDLGYVRFNDARLNSICGRFEDEKHAIEVDDITNQMRRPANKKEFMDNEREIKEFRRKAVIHDNAYTNIESYFRPRIQQRLDSLSQVRSDLYKRRNALIKKMRQK